MLAAEISRQYEGKKNNTAGLELANRQGLSFGVNYNLQLSEHRTGHGLYGVFSFEF
jgi:hypothetical protein